MQNKYVATIVILGVAFLIAAVIYTVNTETIRPLIYVQCSNKLSEHFFPALQHNESYICALVGGTYKLPLGNFSLNSITQNSADIKVNGYCLPCSEPDNSPLFASFSYTLQINQTADTACATGSELELIALNSTHSEALFKESEYNGACP
jgi:hypothetical protein